MSRGGANPFEALASSETRAERKRERAAEHAEAQAETRLSSQHDEDACASPQGSSTCSGHKAGQPYSLALAADNLLIALEAGSGRQLACFTISGPEQAADPGFLDWVRQQLGGPAAGLAEHAQREQQAAASSANSGGPCEAAVEDPELSHLLGLMMVGDSSSPASPAAAGQTSPGVPAGAAEAATLGTGAAAAAGRAAQPPASPVEAWFDAHEEPAVDDWQLDGLDWRQLQQAAGQGWDPQQRQHGSSSGGGVHDDDWRLAAQLQAEEDAALAAAAADQPPSPAAHLTLLQLSDWELAQRIQEEEDAQLAAALAEQEQAAGASAARTAAQQSSSFWARLRPAGEPHLQGSGCDTAAGSAGPNSSFPALQAQAPVDHAAAARAERTRRQLLAQHRLATQVLRERGSGVRVLHRGGGGPGSPPPGPAQQASWMPSGDASGGGLPPLQLEGGLVLHEDDLDYQLLLRDDDVAAVAREAASRHASRSEAVADAGGPGAGAGPTSATMRAMIDATARRAAAGAGGSSRPGSAQGEAPLATSRPGSAAVGEAGAGAAGAAAAGGAPPTSAAAAGALPVVTGPFVDSTAPVDTKSFRRLIEDMRRRGWQMLGSAGGGHLRCERVLPDLPGLKQVYFLCSTPSDVNYIWNVAAAVKRFDREVEERRAEAAATPAAQAGADGAGSSGAGGARGWWPSTRQRR